MRSTRILVGLLAVLCFSAVAQAQTTEAWYLCPYDVTHNVGTVELPQDRMERRCAIYRHIPGLPDGNGSDWDEAETLNGWCLVWVKAIAAVHAVIEADGDFEIVPIPTIPQSLRGRIRSRLRAFGYTDAEINGTGWDSFAIMTLATSAATNYRRTPGGDTIEEDPAKPGRQPPPKKASEIKGWPQ